MIARADSLDNAHEYLDSLAAHAYKVKRDFDMIAFRMDSNSLIHMDSYRDNCIHDREMGKFDKEWRFHSFLRSYNQVVAPHSSHSLVSHRDTSKEVWVEIG